MILFFYGHKLWPFFFIDLFQPFEVGSSAGVQLPSATGRKLKDIESLTSCVSCFFGIAGGFFFNIFRFASSQKTQYPLTQNSHIMENPHRHIKVGDTVLGDGYAWRVTEVQHIDYWSIKIYLERDSSNEVYLSSLVIPTKWFSPL